MAAKTDLRDPADETGEVTLALLREEFEHSFVPRSERDAGIPKIIPKVGAARIAGRQSKVTGAAMVNPGFSITPRSQVTP